MQKFLFSLHFPAILLYSGIFLYRLTKWVLNTFGGITTDQLLFHVFTKTEGMPDDILRIFIIEVGVKPLLGVVIFYLIASLLNKFKIIHRIFSIAAAIVSTLLIIIVLIKWYDMFFTSVVSSEFSQRYKTLDVFEDHYIAPKLLTKPKSNLLWIYFESLEANYVNKNVRFKDANNSYDGKFYSLTGTEWTMAGIVASQCGVPLLPNPLAERGEHLKGTACLSDLLKSLGYANHYIGGAPLSFSGKGDFLKAHKFDSVIGQDELKSILKIQPPSKSEYWGYRDDQLFEILEKNVINLHDRGQPFYYLALTLDTHGPLVYSPDCEKYQHGKTDLGIFQCGIERINSLMDRLESRGVLENTTVVVSGDHPRMKSFQFRWQDVIERKKFERNPVYYYIRPASSSDNHGINDRKNIKNHFDLYANVMIALGGEFNGSAGFGRARDLNSLSDLYTVDEFNYRLGRPSNFYEKLWIDGDK